MLKLTLTTDEPSSLVLDRMNAISQAFGVDVEVIGLDGYVVACCLGKLTVAIPAPAPFAQFQPSPVTTPVPTVEVTPEPPVEG